MRLLTLLAGAVVVVTTINQGMTVDTIAEDYVKLVLAVGQHDADFVDAYYGPPEWKKAADASKVSITDLAANAAALSGVLQKQPAPGDEMAKLRRQYLQRQLAAVSARLRMLRGERLTFDEESQALYDATAPTQPESHFEQILASLEKRFPGTGPLVERYDAYRRAFVIPKRNSTRSSRPRSPRVANAP